jgi:hypothetical protein
MPRRRTPKNHTEMAEIMSSRWQSFPNVGGLTRTTGEYDQFSQTIRLLDITEDQLSRAFDGGDYTLRRDVIPLLAHEVRHFGDHVGTLWGREKLIQLFDAYNVRLLQKLSEFWRVTQVLRDHRDTHLASYYSEEMDSVADDWNGMPWRYDLTTGIHINPDGTENEKKPILFTRFSTFGGEYLCRVPFSIASLLEVRAMSNEIFQLMGLIQDIDDGAVKKIEEEEIREKANKRIFDATLAVYSVAAHYLSNTIREIKDVIEAYLIGGEIAGICLNMPWRFFTNLRVPDSFSPWGARNDALKRNCDRGYLYAALIKNHPQGLRGLQDFDSWIEAALKASGLPTLAVINKTAQEDDKAILSAVVEGPVSDRLRDLLAVGQPYLTHLCAPRRQGGVMVNPATPPVLTSDSKFVSLPDWPNKNTFATPEKWHEMAYRCYTRMEQFLDACVI